MSGRATSHSSRRRSRKRYSPRRSKAERREQVLDAALRVLDAGGFAEFSVEAVARDADIAKTVVYDAVGNQADVLRELFAREKERAINDIAAVIPMPPFEEPEAMLGDAVEGLLNKVLEHPATWRLILLPPEGTPPELRKAVDESRALLRQTLVPIVSWGIDRLRADDLDPEIATHALLATIENGIRLTLTDPARYEPARLADFGRAIVRRVKLAE